MKLKAILSVLFLAFGLAAFAQQQQPLTPEQKEAKLYESIEKQLDDLTSKLDLEDWQVFYADSILTHDYKAMTAEMEALQGNKVENTDLYVMVQDKWMEQIYNSFHKIFDEEQWVKYGKMGAARAKKARDKRAAKNARQ